jgi:hypothetical protein
MLHLQTGFQLKEEVLVGFGIVQVLNGAGTLIPNVLHEALGCQFHLMNCLCGDNYGRSLLKDLLETALCRIVTSIECNSINMLITHDLDLNVMRVLAKLHDEDG